MHNKSAVVTHYLCPVADQLFVKIPNVRKKNPAAVELGRLGGKRGGKSRMAKMSPEERSEFASQGGKVGGKIRAQKLSKKQLSEIGRKAAEARWGKRKTK